MPYIQHIKVSETDEIKAALDEAKALREGLEKLCQKWRGEIEYLYEQRGTFPLVSLEDRVEQVEKLLGKDAK